MKRTVSAGQSFGLEDMQPQLMAASIQGLLRDIDRKQAALRECRDCIVQWQNSGLIVGVDNLLDQIHHALK
jgi:hypothetical protein